jgi:hypothetical protein
VGIERIDNDLPPTMGKDLNGENAGYLLVSNRLLAK